MSVVRVVSTIAMWSARALGYKKPGSPVEIVFGDVTMKLEHEGVIGRQLVRVHGQILFLRVLPEEV
jgi:hypothetical protein